VILTGEALPGRENAETIASLLAEQRGEFVCATAGHHMESIARSLRLRGRPGILRLWEANILKRRHRRPVPPSLPSSERGKVIATAAVHVGGRLLVIDEGRRIVRLDPAGRHLAAQAGFNWSRGDVADAASMERVAEWMAEAVLASVSERPLTAEVQTLFRD